MRLSQKKKKLTKPNNSINNKFYVYIQFLKKKTKQGKQGSGSAHL